MSRLFKSKSPADTSTPTPPTELVKDLASRRDSRTLAATSSAILSLGSALYDTRGTPNDGTTVRGRETGWQTAYGAARMAVEITKESSDMFLPLKAVVGAVSVLIKNYDQTSDNTEGMKEIERRVQSLSGVLTSPVSENDEREKERRTKLRRRLEGVITKLEPLSGQHAVVGFLRNIDNAKALTGFVQELADAVTDYQVSVQQGVYERTKNIHDDTKNILETTDLDILMKLKPVLNAGYQAGHHDRCLPGTRESVLQDIMLWARDPRSQNVFWLNGLAGTGKSTIAQSFSDMVDNQGFLGASFFCSRDYIDRRELKNIFTTLAYQLACHYPHFRSHIVTIIKKDPTLAHTSLISQLENLLVIPLSKANNSCVIIIDALDECIDDQPASAILSVLGRFVKQLPLVKFFITGRPEPRIRTGFRLPLLEPLTQIFLLHGVELSSVNNDIQLYLTQRLTAISKQRSDLKLPNPWPHDKEIKVLTKKSSGLFIFASTLARFIESDHHEPDGRLQLVLSEASGTTHEGRAGIDFLYSQVLLHAFSDVHELGVFENVKSVLGAIVLAFNPLSRRELSEILSVSLTLISTTLRHLHSVILVPTDEDKEIRIFHKSFPDFLQDSKRCSDPRFYVNPVTYHEVIVLGCLELVKKLRRNPCSLPPYTMNQDVPNLPQLLEDRLGGAMRYACRYWARHLSLLPVSYIHQVIIAVAEILRGAPLWIEVMSLENHLEEVIHSMYGLLDWLDKVIPITQDEVQTAQNKSNTAQHKLKTAQHELNTAQRELNAAKYTLDTAPQKLDVAQHKLNTAKHELNAAQEELNATKNTLDAIQHELNTAQNELSSAQHKLNTAQHKLNAVQHKLNTVQHTVNTTQHNAAISQHTAATTRYHMAITQHETATAQHRAATTKYEAATAKHKVSITQHEAAIAQHEAAIAQHEAAIAQDKTAASKHKVAITQHQAAVAQHEVAVTEHEASIPPHEIAISQYKAITTLYNLAADCLRLSMHFFYPIQQCAQQVYYTALPLSPTSSLLHSLHLQSTIDNHPFHVPAFSGAPDAWGLLLRTINIRPKQLTCIATSLQRIIAACEDIVNIYDAVTFALRQSLYTPEMVTKIEDSPDGSILFFAHSFSVTMWDVQTGGLIHTFTTQSKVNDITVSKTGDYIACGLSDGSVAFWNVHTREGRGFGSGQPVVTICWLSAVELAVVTQDSIYVGDISIFQTSDSLSIPGCVWGMIYLGHDSDDKFLVGTSLPGKVVGQELCSLEIISYQRPSGGQAWWSSPRLGQLTTRKTLREQPPVYRGRLMTPTRVGDKIVYITPPSGVQLLNAKSHHWANNPPLLDAATSVVISLNRNLVAQTKDSIQIFSLDALKAEKIRKKIHPSHIHPLGESHIVCLQPTRHLTLLSLETLQELRLGDDTSLLRSSLANQLPCTRGLVAEFGVLAVMQAWQLGFPLPEQAEAAGEDLRLCGFSPSNTRFATVYGSPWRVLCVKDAKDGAVLAKISLENHNLRAGEVYDLTFDSETKFHLKVDGPGWHVKIPYETMTPSPSGYYSYKITQGEPVPLPEPRATPPYSLDANCEWVVDAESRKICWISPGNLRRGNGGHFWVGLSLVMLGDDGVVRKLTFKEPDY